MRKQIGLLIVFVTSLLLTMACANIGTPDGGPYDETPPKVVRTSPTFGATKAKHKKIVLEFDENIKLDNASEKVVVSPPQLNAPEISAMGKRITVELMDSLQPDMTYTIDFADAIEDNNEGNPMGDYAFTFSTGERLDTFQVSGNVLNAQDLEPIKGILVGLYTVGDSAHTDELPDSVFRTRPLERISRTDSRGHFIIKGLNPQKRYRVFALQDQDQDYRYSQQSEMVAFNNRILTLSAKPDIRPDTIWHDSIYYDSIIMKPYTHFYPDDITLLAFKTEKTNRAFIKYERQQPEKFTLFFSAPDDSIKPRIEGLNFNAENAFVEEQNGHNDTISYWIRDSLLYQQDTLSIRLVYRATDTLGTLVESVDTLDLLPRTPYARILKQKAQEWEDYAKEYIKTAKQEMKAKQYEEEKEEEEQTNPVGDDPKNTKKKKNKKSRKINDEDIEVPPMPEKFLELRTSNGTFDPDQNFDLQFQTPIDTFYLDKIHFSQVVDSDTIAAPFVLKRLPRELSKFRLFAEWRPDHQYILKTDTGAFVDIYAMRAEENKRTLKIKALNTYATLFVHLQNTPEGAIVSLLNSSGKVVKQQKSKQGQADFYFINPGTYYLSMFIDSNADGEWTTGDYDAGLQPEAVYFYPGAFNLKADWEISQSWNPLATPVTKQKPGRITKQKPEKEKTIKNRNAERNRNKNNGNRNNSGSSSNSYGGGQITY